MLFKRNWVICTMSSLKKFVVSQQIEWDYKIES
jgi:hypothetical protein